MKVSFLLVLIVSFLFSPMAEGASHPEEQDILITLRGDTIIGQAEINLAKKWVEVRGKNTYRLIAFRSIHSLQLRNTKGQTVTVYRQYSDIDHSTRDQLLRQVIKGPIHYLVKSVPQVHDAYVDGIYRMDHRKAVRNDYYLWHNGDLIRVGNFKKQLADLCLTKAEEAALKAYVEKFGFRYSKPSDQMALIKKLNFLRQSASDVVATLR